MCPCPVLCIMRIARSLPSRRRSRWSSISGVEFSAGHHWYWTGQGTITIALAACFSAMEVVSLTSWFLIFALLTWMLASSYYPAEYRAWSVPLYWLMDAVTAIMLFVSVLQCGFCSGESGDVSRPSRRSHGAAREYGFSEEMIRTFLFVNLIIAGHSTLYVTRVEGWFWRRPRPSPLLFGATFGTEILGTLIGVCGFLIKPIVEVCALDVGLRPGVVRGESHGKDVDLSPAAFAG